MVRHAKLLGNVWQKMERNLKEKKKAQQNAADKVALTKELDDYDKNWGERVEGRNWH